MAAAVGNTSGANSAAIPQQQQQDTGEIAEYKKILNIRDQIFSGSHPRLKVPPHVIRKISPRSAQATAAPAPQAPASHQEKEQAERPVVGNENGEVYAAQYAAQAEEEAPSRSAIRAVGAAQGPGRPSVSKPTSEIDPIFLTKSDDLIRAEMQLQRQRIERGLRERFEQQKLGLTQKPSQQESKPDFDVADVYTKALELVKPITISEREAANRNVATAASDSFDENSLYSSKAPDSPPHAEQQQQQSLASPVSERHARPVGGVEYPDADMGVGRRASAGREYDPADYNPVTMAVESPRYRATRRSPENVAMRDVSPGPYDQPAPYDEPEYSPPGPEGPMARHEREEDYSPQARKGMRDRPSYRASGNDQSYQENMSAPRGPTVVNNHITSPAAPQPSRVSPLAVSRVSSMQGQQGSQGRQGAKVSGGQGSGRSSPEGPSQPVMSRKRRRVQETRDKPRYAAQRRAAESPEVPYIKPEPESPPPLADVPVSPTYGRTRGARRAVPIEMDVEPARYAPVTEQRRERGRVVPAYDDRYSKSYDIESTGADIPVPRSPSGMAYRRPLREGGGDLRRVASLQNARQAEYTTFQDYGEAELPPRYARAASYGVADRPAPTERAQYYEEAPPPPPPPQQPSYGRRYVTGPASPPSPQYREDYVEARRPMVPPQRRVVVDADGNRYYESVPTAPKPAPPPRYARAEEYEEGPPMRGGSVRAVSVMEHPYGGERRYRQEMPPPPPPPPAGYRRAAPEYSRSVAPEPRVYSTDADARRSLAPALRSGSVQVVDYRGGGYIDDEPHYPREEIVRIPSARPPPSRYDEPQPQPREAAPRMQSVRPTAREMSVYVDDQTQPQARPRQEYAPIERAAYTTTAAPATRAATRPPVREERYYDDEEPSPQMAYDRGGPEMVRRVSRRY